MVFYDFVVYHLPKNGEAGYFLSNAKTPMTVWTSPLQLQSAAPNAAANATRQWGAPATQYRRCT
jgi:hypothetical protein